MKIIAYFLSVIFYLFFGLTLVVFHGIQWICLKFGYQAHKKSVDVFNFFLLACLKFLGNYVSFDNPYQFTKDRPHLIIANHQSMFDIPPLIWYLQKLHPKFISKKELGQGIPGISFNLKHGGSVLIDRNDSEQALKAISKFCEYLNETKNSAVIFPEGTRTKTGLPKEFSRNGLRTLFKSCPEAVVVPVTINNSWLMQKWGMFPLGIFVNLKFKVHQPLKIEDYSSHEVLIDKIENQITSAINHPKQNS
ncbi:MAG: lysophospholipid acyltransferase family protein [Psychroflexus halocasei]